jgi:mRNA interferase RelE/StbE
MMYQVIIKKEALKELKHFPAQSVKALTNSIEKLSQNPRPPKCKKLNGTKENLWRIRVGDYRIVYLIDDVIRIVNVRAIGNRKDVYE